LYLHLASFPTRRSSDLKQRFVHIYHWWSPESISLVGTFSKSVELLEPRGISLGLKLHVADEERVPVIGRESGIRKRRRVGLLLEIGSAHVWTSVKSGCG